VWSREVPALSLPSGYSQAQWVGVAESKSTCLAVASKPFRAMDVAVQIDNMSHSESISKQLEHAVG
jgi:hypothetical protein